MKNKRITKLSELYNIISNYLYAHGDANIVSISTHCNSDINNHLKYSFDLEPLDSSNNERDVITIDYHNISIK